MIYDTEGEEKSDKGVFLSTKTLQDRGTMNVRKMEVLARIRLCLAGGKRTKFGKKERSRRVSLPVFIASMEGRGARTLAPEERGANSHLIECVFSRTREK